MTDGRTLAEFFAGVGLVGEGLAAGGWRPVYANDVSPQKRRLFEARNPDAGYYHLEDVRRTDEIVERMPPRVDLATASFPCIDLSTAGHYRGLAGEHSSLFYAFLAVLDAVAERPPLVLIENVTGFLTSNGGEDFREATRLLSERGYWLDAAVVDARWFVPQSRPRVFLVGALEPRREERLDAYAPSPLRPPRMVEALDSSRLKTGWVRRPLPEPPPEASPLEEALDLTDAAEWWDREQVERHEAMLSDRHRAAVDALADGRAGTGYRRIRAGVQRLEVRFDGVAGCLRTAGGGSARQIVVARRAGRVDMRWMSAAEYAALQGAAGFPLVGPVTHQLAAFGDAVCVPAVAWVERHLIRPHARGADESLP